MRFGRVTRVSLRDLWHRGERYGHVVRKGLNFSNAMSNASVLAFQKAYWRQIGLFHQHLFRKFWSDRRAGNSALAVFLVDFERRPPPDAAEWQRLADRAVLTAGSLSSGRRAADVSCGC